MATGRTDSIDLIEPTNRTKITTPVLNLVCKMIVKEILRFIDSSSHRFFSHCMDWHKQGRTHGGGGEGLPPWDLKKHKIFRVFSVKFVICIFAACVLKLFAIHMWEDRGNLQHGKELRKVDFRTLLTTIYEKSYRPPLIKLWVLPWVGMN